MNEWAEAVRREAKKMLGWPYEMGGRGPTILHPDDYGIDCRGFAQRAYKLAGAAEVIGDGQPNVRHMVAWAKNNGRFRGPHHKPGLVWPIFYNEPSAMPGPAANPDCIRHVALFLQPVSTRWPKGRAISALNPEFDVCYHALNLPGLAIYGYTAPDWASLESEGPIVDPEPPITVAADDVER